jgi:DNA-binding response OmpR family regulator
MLGERSDQQATGASGRPHSSVRAVVVDRDSGFIQVLEKRLQPMGWDYRIVSSPVTVEALVRMRLNALIVDLSMIGPDCWAYLEQVCSRLPSLAVVVCTSPSSVSQRVRGLRLGVDAWVTKPCHPEELICIVEAALRRHRRQELVILDPPTIVGELTVRSELHQVYVGETSVELTAREFEIVQLLIHADRVLRREEIYERVWGYAMAHGDRSVDVFIGKVRQKLRNVSPRWTYIHTHFGVGYRFAPVAEPRDSAEAAPSMTGHSDKATAPAATVDALHDALR